MHWPDNLRKFARTSSQKATVKVCSPPPPGETIELKTLLNLPSEQTLDKKSND